MTTRAKPPGSEPPPPTASSLVAKAVGMLAVLTLLTGVVYPLAVTGIARVAMADRASGSLLVHDGRVTGSRLVGQPFADPRYFWGRPSATTPAPYNGGSSAGSNLGPTNEALTKAVKERVSALRAADPGNTDPVPVDLVTASASGLDPHITPAAALYQVRRVARARGMSEAAVRELALAHTDERTLGVLGERRVNVLALNLALDAAGPSALLR